MGLRAEADIHSRTRLAGAGDSGGCSVMQLTTVRIPTKHIQTKPRGKADGKQRQTYLSVSYSLRHSQEQCAVADTHPLTKQAHRLTRMDFAVRCPRWI